MCCRFVIIAVGKLLVVTIFVLESSQLLKIFIDIGVKIVERISLVAGFGAEEDHQDPLNTTEWEENPETVFPAQIGGNGPSDDANQTGNGAEDKVK